MASQFEAKVIGTLDTSKIESALEKLQDKKIEFKNVKIDGLDEASKSAKEYSKNVDQASKSQSQLATTQARIGTLSNQMTSWLNNNSKAAKQYGDRVRELQQELSKSDGSNLTEIRAKFGQIKSEANAAGLTTNTFASSLKNVALQAVGITSVATAVRKVISEVKEGINTIVGLDDALVDLQKTSSATASQLNQAYTEANTIAKQYGATTKDIIQGMADWSRLGWLRIA